MLTILSLRHNCSIEDKNWSMNHSLSLSSFICFFLLFFPLLSCPFFLFLTKKWMEISPPSNEIHTLQIQFNLFTGKLYNLTNSPVTVRDTCCKLLMTDVLWEREKKNPFSPVIQQTFKGELLFYSVPWDTTSKANCPLISAPLCGVKLFISFNFSFLRATFLLLFFPNAVASVPDEGLIIPWEILISFDGSGTCEITPLLTWILRKWHFSSCDQLITTKMAVASTSASRELVRVNQDLITIEDFQRNNLEELVKKLHL